MNEQLNRMKYLFEAERGKVIREPEILSTYISEQDSNTFPLNFGVGMSIGGFKLLAKNVNYRNENFDILWSMKADRFVGSQTKTEYIPGSESTIYERPIIEIPIVGGESFDPNFITPKDSTIKSLKNSAKSVVSAVEAIIKLDPKEALTNIDKFLGNGFYVEGHADGSPPIETRLSATDHGKLGLYGGNKKTYDKNTWLAENRAKRAYSVFKKELDSLMSTNFSDAKIIDAVVNKFILNDKKLKIINHLNRDGSANLSEIGPQFRKMVFIPTFKTELEIPITTKIPGREEKTTIEGTKEGTITIPVFEDGKGGFEGIMVKDSGIPGGVFMGVTSEDANRLHEITDTTYDGKEVVMGEIKGKEFLIDGRFSGVITELNSNTKGIDVLGQRYITTPMLCVNEAYKPREINNIMYYPVFYYMCSFVKPRG